MSKIVQTCVAYGGSSSGLIVVHDMRKINATTTRYLVLSRDLVTRKGFSALELEQPRGIFVTTTTPQTAHAIVRLLHGYHLPLSLRLFIDA